MGAVLAKFLGRILTYLLGLVVVIALVGMGAFVLARPQIDEFVTAEIKKRGLEVESWDLSFNGRAHLRQVRTVLPGGIELTAALISGRPPVAGFPGAATLYDVRLERGNVSLTIPELDVSAISQHEKNSNLPNRALQALNQFGIGRIKADAISLNMPTQEGAMLKLGGLVLEDMERGRIGHLSMTEIEAQFEGSHQQMMQGNLHMAALDVREMDMTAALSYLAGQAETGDETTVPIIGPVNLYDIRFEGEVAAKSLNLKLGSLTSQGITLRRSDIVPLDTIRNFVVAQRDGASQSEKKQAQQKLLSLLTGLEGIDVTLADGELATPMAELNLQSLSLRSSDWSALLPQQLDVAIAGLVLNIINPPEEIKPVLATTGYDKIAASAALRTRWDRESQRLDLEDLSFAAENIGDFSVKFQIDNIDSLPFGQTEEENQVWLQKLRLHEFDMGVRDRGAVDNFAAIIADIGGVEANEIRQGFEDMARGTPPILFENEALAANAEQALLTFLRQSGLLRLHVASKAETGLALEQLMSDAVDWPTLLTLAEISFTHETDATSN